MDVDACLSVRVSSTRLKKLMYACHEYQLILAKLILEKLKKMELRFFEIFDNSNSIWTQCIQRIRPIYELF